MSPTTKHSHSHPWHGVIPAITTPFNRDLSIDHAFLASHAGKLIDAGCTGIVAPGSLGEGSALSSEERLAVWHTLVKAIGSRASVFAAIASASTREAEDLAKAARDAGCIGLMVLPAYVYKGSWRETRAHVSAIMRATSLSCMLYNNPLAYGTDFTPTQIAELVEGHANLHAVKESSADARRLAAIRELIDDRLALLVGVDDLLVEGVMAGATGWTAGLVNALPRESVRLFELARAACTGDAESAAARREVDALYRWFLPLLRMDTTYDFVQLIKLVQAEVGLVGVGGAITRPPRLMPEGEELARMRSVIRDCLSRRPRLERA